MTQPSVYSIFSYFWKLILKFILKLSIYRNKLHIELKFILPKNISK